MNDAYIQREELKRLIREELDERFALTLLLPDCTMDQIQELVDLSIVTLNQPALFTEVDDRYILWIERYGTLDKYFIEAIPYISQDNTDPLIPSGFLNVIQSLVADQEQTESEAAELFEECVFDYNTIRKGRKASDIVDAFIAVLQDEDSDTLFNKADQEDEGFEDEDEESVSPDTSEATTPSQPYIDIDPNTALP